MKVNFEFLGPEPIENVITAMRFKMDKVIFISYDEQMASQNDNVNAFLQDCCGVKEIDFIPVERDNLAEIKATISKYIEKELAENNDIYFDVTGGEGLILTAFGMLSERYKAPIHLFSVERDEIIEVDEGANRVCSRDVERNDVTLDKDKYLELRGYMPSDLPDNIQLEMDGNIPIVTICYIGNNDPKTDLITRLSYVLEDNAKKFGGKYAKKIFKTPIQFSETSMSRANVMGIDVQIV